MSETAGTGDGSTRTTVTEPAPGADRGAADAPTTDAVATTADAPPPAGRGSALADAALLLLSPLVAFLALRVRPMTDLGLVDSWIYTGYQLNGSDLVRRYGPDTYYWVRLGTTLPERASSWLFGPLPGFFVLRYLLILLAVVPLYVALRRFGGRAVGWAAVVAVLASPVTWNAWGTDYPDSLIVSYLIGGVALLALPLTHRVLRPAAWIAAGVLFSMAVHSQVVVAPLVVVAVGVHLLVTRPGWRAAVLRALGLAATFVVVTVALAAVARRWVGQWDIITPTVRNYQALQAPDQLAMWHSSDRSWIAHIPSTLAPYAIVVGWLVVRWFARRDERRGIGPVESALGWTATGAAVVWAGLQFVGTVATLEYRLYVSALWALCLPVLGVVVARLAGGAASRWRWLAPAVLAVGGLALSVPATVRALDGVDRFRYAALAVAVAVVVAVLTVRLAGVRLIGAVAMVAVVAGLTGLPASKPSGPGFSPLPQPRYTGVFDGIGERYFTDSYAVAAQLPAIIGPGRPGEQVLFWCSLTLPYQTSSDLAATYLWRFIPQGIPSAQSRQAVIDRALEQRPQPLVIVTSTAAEAASFVAVWDQAGHPLTVQDRRTVTGGGLTVTVWIARPTEQL